MGETRHCFKWSVQVIAIKRRNLAEDAQAVIWQQSIRLIQKKVSADKLLETPILALHEAIRSL